MGGEGSEGQVREVGRVVVVIYMYPINYLYMRGWVNG